MYLGVLWMFDYNLCYALETQHSDLVCYHTCYPWVNIYEDCGTLVKIICYSHNSASMWGGATNLYMWSCSCMIDLLFRHWQASKVRDLCWSSTGLLPVTEGEFCNKDKTKRRLSKKKKEEKKRTEEWRCEIFGLFGWCLSIYIYNLSMRSKTRDGSSKRMLSCQ